MEPQDELLRLIRQLVAARVPLHQQQQFVQIVTLTVAQLMADPRFLAELSVVKELRTRIAHLTNENLLLKQVMSQRPPPPPRKKPPAPRKRAPAKSATKAFQQGVHDVTRRK